VYCIYEIANHCLVKELEINAQPCTYTLNAIFYNDIKYRKSQLSAHKMLIVSCIIFSSDQHNMSRLNLLYKEVHLGTKKPKHVCK